MIKIAPSILSADFANLERDIHDIESRGGAISRLSIPIQEMRQYRNEICKELYGVESIRTLSAKERLKLAKVIRSRYNSSLKQIARVCGLVYEEVKDMI